MPTDEQRNWVQSALGVMVPSESRPNVDSVSSGAAANTKNSPEVPNASDTKAAATKPFAISASVGHHGKNQPEDVKAVQAALNQCAKAGLDLDGKCGSKTLDAIKSFQKKLGFRKPDGLIEPGKRTAIALTGAKVGPPEESEQAGGADDSGTESDGAGQAPAPPATERKGNADDSGLVKSALAAAQEIVERDEQAKKSCVGWVKKIADMLAVVTAAEAIAEGTKIKESLKKELVDHHNGPVLQVKAAAQKLAALKTAQAAEVVNEAVAAALPGFKILDDLTDEAMFWTTINSHPMAAPGERRIGGKEKADAAQAIEAATQAARGIAEREEKTLQSVGNWMKRILDTLAGVSEAGATAEGKKLQKELERVSKEHHNGPVREVKVAAKKLAAQPTAQAAEVVNQAIKAALPGFKALDDLTDEAMFWTGINSHPIAAPGERRVGGKEKGDASQTIAVAAQAAREMVERAAQVGKTCQSALDMFAKKLKQASGTEAAAEGRKLKEDLEQAYKEHSKKIKVVADTARDLSRKRTADVANAVQQACEAANPGFKILDDLTQAAMEWQAFNTRHAAAR